MRIIIDTDVFLDVLMEREPFYKYSKAVLDLCESRKLEGFLPAFSVANLFYLVSRELHSRELAYKALGSVLDIVKVLTVTNQNVLDAYIEKSPDFGDCLLAVCAKANKCDVIVTRNKDEFENFGLRLLSPEELLHESH